MATYSIDHADGSTSDHVITSEDQAIRMVSTIYNVPVSELVTGDWESWKADGDEERKLVWLSEELADNDDGKNAACQITRSRS